MPQQISSEAPQFFLCSPAATMRARMAAMCSLLSHPTQNSQSASTKNVDDHGQFTVEPRSIAERSSPLLACYLRKRFSVRQPELRAVLGYQHCPLRCVLPCTKAAAFGASQGANLACPKCPHQPTPPRREPRVFPCSVPPLPPKECSLAPGRVQGCPHLATTTEGDL